MIADPATIPDGTVDSWQMVFDFLLGERTLVCLHAEGGKSIVFPDVSPYSPKVKIDLLVIHRDVPDPVLRFWEIRHDGYLADRAYVVFLEPDSTDPGYADLARVYPLVVFGRAAFMQYQDGPVPVLPSQRGMYMQ